MNESTAYLLHKLVITMDKSADKLLQKHFGISYKRANFLVRLQIHGTITQHELALSLGYSDPAVSTMLLPLIKEKYVTVRVSPQHKRKRLITLTPQGEEFATKGRKFLDEHFATIIDISAIDVKQYDDATERLYKALTQKMKGELV